MSQRDHISMQTTASQLLRECRLQLVIERQLDARGRVFLAKDRYAKLQRCVKILDYSAASKRQLESLRRVDGHQQIVPNIIEVRRAKDKLVLVSNWIVGHSLRQYLRAANTGHHSGISLHQSLVMFRVFASQLSSLHRSGFVVHGDIKPDNILISKGATWRMMLVDFGSSWNAERTINRDEGDGVTPVYAAPECQTPHARAANYLSDQFSASVVMYEILTGDIPYDRLGGTVGTKSITLQKPSEQLLDRAPYPKQLVKKVDALICQGLSVDPGKRFVGHRDWQNAAYEAAALLQPTHGSSTHRNWVDRLQAMWRKTS